MNHQKSHDEEYKLPEFVDVTEEFEEHQEENGYGSIPKLKVQLPFYVRIIALFCCLGISLWVLFNLFFTLVFGLFSAITFFKNERLVETVRGFWERVCRNSVMALGFFVAMFSPQLGLIFVITYFMMNDEKWQESMMGEVINSQFGQYYQ